MNTCRFKLLIQADKLLRRINHLHAAAWVEYKEYIYSRADSTGLASYIPNDHPYARILRTQGAAHMRYIRRFAAARYEHKV